MLTHRVHFPIAALAAVCLALAACGGDDPVQAPPPSGCAPPSAGAWAWQHPLPQGNPIRAIDGITEFDIWAVGAGGEVLRWRGIDWSLHSRPVTTPLYGVLSPAAGDVHVVGAGGVILALSGDVLAPVPSPTTRDLRAIWGESSADMFAVGHGGRILRNTGAGWSEVITGATGDLYAMWGLPKVHEIYAVGAGGTVVHFDGVSTWTVPPPFTSANLYGVWADKPFDWFTVGEGGEIWRNRGAGWTPMASPTTANLYGIFGGDSAYVFAVGDADSVLFFDGDRWSFCHSAGPCLRNPVSRLNGGWSRLCALPFAAPEVPRAPLHCSLSLIVGAGGIVGAYDVFGNYSPQTDAQTYAPLRGVHGRAAGDCYTVGDGGVILHGDGVDWEARTSGVSERLSAVWVVSAGRIVAVGDGGRILESVDGMTWTPMASNTSADLTCVWAAPTGEMFAAGDGVVLRHDQGWQVQAVTTGGWAGMWGFSPEDVTVVGAGGLIAHFDGTGWSAGATQVSLAAVWGSAPGALWAVGVGGTILRGDGSGWQAVSGPVTDDLHSVWGLSACDVMAVGAGGVAIRYDGSSWVVDRTLSVGGLRALWGTEPGTFLAVGDDGNILEYAR
jgi:hypothetical protein